jgi:protein-disulfide isomerase
VIDADVKDGEEAGVNGTPAFYINGRMLSGAQPFDAFKRIIDEELELKKK